MKRVLTCICLSALTCMALAASQSELYFRQFLFHFTQDTSDPEFPGPKTWYLLGSSDFVISIDDHRERIVRIEVYLNDNYTHKTIYHDSIREKDADSWPLGDCLEITGHWDVPGEHLMIYDNQGKALMEGSRTFWYGQHAVGMKFLSAFPIEGVRGAENVFPKVQSPNEPRQTCFPF